MFWLGERSSYYSLIDSFCNLPKWRQRRYHFDLGNGLSVDILGDHFAQVAPYEIPVSIKKVKGLH